MIESSSLGYHAKAFQTFVKPDAVYPAPLKTDHFTFQPGARAIGRDLFTGTQSASPLSTVQLKDDVAELFQNRDYPSPESIIGAFAAGFAITLTGREAGRFLWPKRYQEARKRATEAAKQVAKQAEKTFENTDNLTVWKSFNEQQTSLLRLAQHFPKMRPALFAYAGFGTGGYLLGNIGQGFQETWVRMQETRTRARLIHRLQEAFRTSIQIKLQMDNQLREDARECIYQILKSNGIRQPESYVQAGPVLEPKQVQQKYFYEPTHRTITPPRFGYSFNKSDFFKLDPQMAAIMNDASSAPKFLFEPKLPWKRVMQAGAFGFGLLAGEVVHRIGQAWGKAFTLAQQSENMVVRETVNVLNQEAVFLAGLNNKALLGSFLLLTAGAAVGKRVLDGLREVEVTRVNAETEYRFQKYNWLVQDPGFHKIAETESLNNAMRALEAKLPQLRDDPEKLKQHIETILNNIGRNSPPPYFILQPPVNLVEARS